MLLGKVGVLGYGSDGVLGCWGSVTLECWRDGQMGALCSLGMINKYRMLDNHSLEIGTKTLAVGFSPRWITSCDSIDVPPMLQRRGGDCYRICPDAEASGERLFADTLLSLPWAEAHG